MLYGLLIAGATVEQQEAANLPAYGAAADEDENAWLGMEAWVSCDSAPEQQVA